jgi:hypothetical protein
LLRADIHLRIHLARPKISPRERQNAPPRNPSRSLAHPSHAVPCRRHDHAGGQRTGERVRGREGARPKRRQRPRRPLRGTTRGRAGGWSAACGRRGLAARRAGGAARSSSTGPRSPSPATGTNEEARPSSPCAPPLVGAHTQQVGVEDPGGAAARRRLLPHRSLASIVIPPARGRHGDGEQMEQPSGWRLLERRRCGLGMAQAAARCEDDAGTASRCSGERPGAAQERALPAAAGSLFLRLRPPPSHVLPAPTWMAGGPAWGSCSGRSRRLPPGDPSTPRGMGPGLPLLSTPGVPAAFSSVWAARF